MLERFRRRESLIFPLPAQRVKESFDEMRELVRQSSGFSTLDQNLRMELNSPDLYEFIQGRKNGYKEMLDRDSYQAYIGGVAIAYKAIEDSVNNIGIGMPEVKWKHIRKYEVRRNRAWKKLDKESHGKTDFVTSVFKTILEEDPSFEVYLDMLQEPHVGDVSGTVILQDGRWVLPPDPASDPLLLQYNMRRFYTCVGISDVYFPMRRADANANRRKK